MLTIAFPVVLCDCEIYFEYYPFDFYCCDLQTQTFSTVYHKYF